MNSLRMALILKVSNVVAHYLPGHSVWFKYYKKILNAFPELISLSLIIVAVYLDWYIRQISVGKLCIIIKIMKY